MRNNNKNNNNKSACITKLVRMQVCLNSGKVRLNSGILERRHSNWDKALHHFRMARQIDDTYCEPGYWIGATLLQQGSNLQLGLMVSTMCHSSIRAFLSCHCLVKVYIDSHAHARNLVDKWHLECFPLAINVQ